jgi:uncharacterized protein DUF190
MQGSLFRFYMHEGHRHHGRLAWEWLLEQGNKLGIRGGSAFKAMAGFGRQCTRTQPQTSLSMAHSWHTQSELDIFLAQPPFAFREAVRIAVPDSPGRDESVDRCAISVRIFIGGP